jgi:FG-GAP-like repeat/FG-GAP repeat
MRRTYLRARIGLALAGCIVFGLLATGASAADPVFTEAPGSPIQNMNQPHSEAAADLNGDGMLDLAVARYGSDDIAILRGNGAGAFAATTSLPVGDGPLGLAAGDLNGDRRPDIAVANADSDNLSILLGDGSGGFAPAGPAIPLTNGPWYVVLGDLDRDRQMDIVVSHVGFGPGGEGPSRDVSVLLGDGAGGFAHAPGSPFTVGDVPYGVEIADFDGDRNPDLAIASQFEDFISIMLGDGTGRFTEAAGSPIHFGAGGPSWLVVQDFDDDRRVDLAVALGSGSIRVLLGNGAGGFASAPGSPIPLAGSPHNLRAADFDRDGELDLGVDRLGNSTVPPNFTVLLGDGAGGFATAGAPNPVGAAPLSMAVGDFNRDRKPDVAVGNNFADSVTVLLNSTVTPADRIAALREEVWASSLSQGLRVSLSAELLVAERTAGMLDNRPACAALSAFIAEVRARTGSGGLTAAIAEVWIAEANAVRADLGCA